MIALEALELTETQLAMQRLAKEFAESEIKPIAAGLDRVQDLASPEAFPWDMLKKACRIGLKTLTLPKEYGGPEEEVSLTTRLIILDQLGFVDYSCAKVISQLWKTIDIIAKVGTQEQKDRFLPEIRDDDSYVISIGMTEPESGSDYILPYEGPEGGMRVTAERRGDGYVLNGMKHFISMGPHCKLCILVARTDKTLGGRKGTSAFLVPKNTPGFSVGTIHDKVGTRAYHNSELIFDNVYVPKENLLGGVEGYGISRAITFGELEIAVLALATARAAYEAALNHAKERVQGGKRIIEHQVVGARIADMFMALQACDSLVSRTVAEINQGKPSPDLCVACKVFVNEHAFDICLQALQIFGGMGVDRTLPMERYLRDVLTHLHGGGTSDVLRLKLVNLLAGENLYGKAVK